MVPTAGMIADAHSVVNSCFIERIVFSSIQKAIGRRGTQSNPGVFVLFNLGMSLSSLDVSWLCFLAKHPHQVPRLSPCLLLPHPTSHAQPGGDRDRKDRGHVV